MTSKINYFVATLAMTFLFGCASQPSTLSEKAFGQKFPLATNAIGENIAKLKFSSETKYETSKGVPMSGDPLICGEEGVSRVNSIDMTSSRTPNQLLVAAGKQISVTSVISWINTGWEKTCWPFVSFIPDAGATYIIVNEKIGGKGVSALWTGVGLQTCQISVYKEKDSGFEAVQTQKSSYANCKSNQ